MSFDPPMQPPNSPYELVDCPQCEGKGKVPQWTLDQQQEQNEKEGITMTMPENKFDRIYEFFLKALGIGVGIMMILVAHELSREQGWMWSFIAVLLAASFISAVVTMVLSIIYDCGRRTGRKDTEEKDDEKEKEIDEENS